MRSLPDTVGEPGQLADSQSHQELRFPAQVRSDRCLQAVKLFVGDRLYLYLLGGVEVHIDRHRVTVSVYVPFGHCLYEFVSFRRG